MSRWWSCLLPNKGMASYDWVVVPSTAEDRHGQL